MNEGSLGVTVIRTLGDMVLASHQPVVGAVQTIVFATAEIGCECEADEQTDANEKERSSRHVGTLILSLT